jgi:protein-tyrosine phosphatase
MGERLLRRDLPDLTIASAGIAAVVGEAADKDANLVAAEIGVDLGGHIARQLTNEIGAAHDLILVMEPGHRQEISRRFPQLSGRTMLFDHWVGAKGIADPFRKSQDFHRATRDQIATAAAAWAEKLRKSKS